MMSAEQSLFQVRLFGRAIFESRVGGAAPEKYTMWTSDWFHRGQGYRNPTFMVVAGPRLVWGKGPLSRWIEATFVEAFLTVGEEVLVQGRTPQRTRHHHSKCCSQPREFRRT